MALDLTKMSIRVQLALGLRPPIRPDYLEAVLRDADYFDLAISPPATAESPAPPAGPG